MATPTLTVMLRLRPPALTGCAALRMICWPQRSTSSMERKSGMTMTNSSPPSARDRIGFAHRGEQALADRGQQDVAVGVAQRVVDLLEIVDVENKDGHALVMLLGARDRLAETLVKKRAVGKPGEMVVVGEVVDVVGAAAVLGDVAAGDGDAVAEFHHLDVEPGALDHVVVDKDFAGIGNAGADDLAVLLDEAGPNHEGAHFGEDAGRRGFRAAHPGGARHSG